MDEEDKTSVVLPDDGAVAAWLSEPRLNRYLRAARTLTGALTLYRWNSVVSAAALIELGNLEVAMRNTYDRALSTEDDWLDERSRTWTRRTGDPRRRQIQTEKNDQSLDMLAEAKKRASGHTHGHIIAATSFGLWSSLTDQNREPTLWTPYLHAAYPKGTKRATVHEMAHHALSLRNRLAHLEPVFTRPTALAERMREVWLLHAMLEPQSADWCHANSLLRSVATKCPVGRVFRWTDQTDGRPSAWLTTH